jgi:bifunctional non-homologous end joining protein LigD
MPAHKEAALEAYRAKRAASQTPEPFGGLGLPDDPDWTKPRMFVVQKHAARRLHYDFRLEWKGTLVSWAIPQGPSTDISEKRLAMMVEDHPVEYADFEGVIPKGNYGAGEVIVWDKGVWLPLEEPDAGFEKGKLLFELRGYKLHGRFTLVRTKRQGQAESKEWLLIKKPDAYAGADGARYLTPESIYSGLTLEEIQEGSKRAGALRERLLALGTPKKRVEATPDFMLAEDAKEPFSDPDFIYELKYDGYRLLIVVEDGHCELIYRRGSRATELYPEIARAASLLPFSRLILDGELVCLDDNARPSFSGLQQRSQLRRTADVAAAAVRLPATLQTFDILAFEDFDLRSLPLVERKSLLKDVLPKAGPLRFVDHIPAEGVLFYNEVQRMGLEGVVAKRADSKYRPGRSNDWRKLKTDKVGDFVVIGMTPREGSRTGFGALHLAAYTRAPAVAGGPPTEPRLIYAGRVGSGFTDDQLKFIRAALDKDVASKPPCPIVDEPRDSTYVEPKHVVEVRYKTWSQESLLRQPVFLRWRDDKPPEECVRPGEGSGETPATPESAVASSHDLVEAKPLVVDKTVRFTNLTKVFWPVDENNPVAYTKGDLIDYYRKVAPWFLPYLADRPITLTRYPDGIHGKSFFQKDAPPFIPGWMRTERLWSEDTGKELDLIIGGDRSQGDLETLLFIANLGAIVLHAWNARASDPARPDWIILDLDPKSAPFEHVITLAGEAKALCDEIGLPCFAKTTGSSGLHVLIPTGGALTHDQCKTFAELLARVLVTRRDAIATIVRLPAQRGGKVYIDFLQNGHGKLLVAPFSVRPLPGAPVSMPLQWSEVREGLTPRQFTIANAIPRLEKLGADPLIGVLKEKPDLLGALGKLGERLG